MPLSTHTQPYIPGPSDWYLYRPSTTTWLFLGNVERDTRIQKMREYEEIFCDVTGTRIPYAKSYQGQRAFVSGDLVKYNEDVLNMIEATLDGATPGADAVGAIGSLPGPEGLSFGLCIVSRYKARAFNASGNMVGVFTAMNAHTDGAIDLSLSTLAKRPRISFDCLPVVATDGSSVTYTSTLPASLPALN